MEILATADELVVHTCDALNQAIVEHLTEADRVHIALTGGSIATALYHVWPTRPSCREVAWDRVEFWWGDERFVPADSPERNAEPAMALLADLPVAAHHPMPASDDPRVAAGLVAAAQVYAAELGSVRMDICLLGLGPDGHVASVFPGHPSMNPSGDPVIAVRNSPKPPPERISLTLQTIAASDEVWFIVSGSGKADAVAGSFHGDDELPGALARGVRRTRWYVDADAAALVR